MRLWDSTASLFMSCSGFASMAQPVISPSLLKLPSELLVKIFNLLTDSKDAVCLALVHSSIREIYSLTEWSSLLVDVRSLRCRLYRDLKNPTSATIYYCYRCTSGRIPCEKHGIKAIVGIEEGRAHRWINARTYDQPLRERLRRIATDNHKYCCMTRG